MCVAPSGWPPARLAAQTTLRGQVDGVRGANAHIALEGDLVPNPGDSVRLGDTVAELGEVALAGTWRVDEVGPGWVWVEPLGPTASPLPGYWARIYSDAPGPAPSGESAAEPDGGVEVLRDLDFAGGATSSEEDGPYCRTRNVEGGFLIRTVSPDGLCFWSYRTDLGYEPPLRITTRMVLRAGELSWGYGLRFGFSRAEDGYYVLLLSGNGSYKLARSGPEGWEDLTDWVRHPAVETGLGARNELVVELIDGAIRYAVNGIPLGEHRQSDPVRGDVGFYLNETGNELLVEALRVEQLPDARVDAGAVVHHDGFDGAQPESTEGPCRTRGVPGGFAVRNANPDGTCFWNLWSAGSFPANVRITLRAALTGGSEQHGYGLKFGTPDRESSSFYTFLVAANGYYRLSRWDGQWSNLSGDHQTDAIATQLGEPNELAIEVRGPAFDLYVNGSYLGTHEGPEPAAGYLALFLWEEGMEVTFQELTVERLATGATDAR